MEVAWLMLAVALAGLTLTTAQGPKGSNATLPSDGEKLIILGVPSPLSF